MSSSQQYRLFASGSAPLLYPTDTMFALLHYGRDAALEVPKRYPYSGEWGQPVSTHMLEREEYPAPGMLDMIWLSVVERKFYSLLQKLPMERIIQYLERKDEADSTQLMQHIVVGMAPFGGVALWLHGHRKSVLIDWMHAEQTEVAMEDFIPHNPTMKLEQICNFYLDQDPRVRENLETNGLPPRDLFDNYMKQFTYRYQVEFGHWDEESQTWNAYTEEEKEKQQLPELDFIEEALFDGTHDKLHDGGLMKYHEAGKPKKLAVQWHAGKKEWTAYFWFEDQEIRNVFDRFYGTHPDNKADLVLQIDQEKNRYELALFRYGLPEPRVISERAYQLIVFKNKFKCFRSENYAQERGAWIW